MGIDSIRNKWLLNFVVKDKQENYLNEERFFRAAVIVPQGAQKIAAVLENFLEYRRGEPFVDGGFYSSAEDQTALIYAAWVLATHDSQYLKLVQRFLLILDWEHCFYERDDFFKDIKDMGRITGDNGIFYRDSMCLWVCR